MKEIVVSTLDYSRLNSLILNLLEDGDSSLAELNRLNVTIKQAKLVDPGKINPDIVTMNSIVEVVFSDMEGSKVFKLVYPPDADPNINNVSVLSPLGQAVLGHKAGETIPLQAMGDTRAMTIVKILYQPEANRKDLKE